MRNSNPTQKETTEVFTKEFSLFPAEDKIVDNWANEKNNKIEVNVRSKNKINVTDFTIDQQHKLSLMIDNLNSQFVMRNRLSNIVATAALKKSDQAFELLEVYIMTAFASTGSMSEVENYLWGLYNNHFSNIDEDMKNDINEMVTEILLGMEHVTPEIKFTSLLEDIYNLV